MKLDIELLNRIKDNVAKEWAERESIGYPIENFNMLTIHAQKELWPEVCRRYSEEVNKKPDTKTAEDIVIATIHKERRDQNLKETEFDEEDKKIIQVIVSCMEEYTSPLKKRIEELEAMVVLKLDRPEHDKIVLTNKRGDTFTSTSEPLIDFLHDYPSTNEA